MSTEWSSFWNDIRNLHWGAVDEVILEQVANVLGWGPARTLVELGAGRGAHSRRLYDAMRCDTPHVYDLCPESYEYMKRAGLHAVMDPSELKTEYDIVWSNGLIEHSEGDHRQEIVNEHFRRSRDWVIFVVPRRNWQRKVHRPRARVPHQTEYTEQELMDRMCEAADACWGGRPATSGVRGFCPLFAVRHIPDAWYPIVDKLLGWALPDGLVIGWARRPAARLGAEGEAGGAT